MTEVEIPHESYAEEESIADNVAIAKWRYRILYSKIGPLRYVSNLDLARLWERICRRARLPLVYSQGFNPRPKIQLAAGLPLGYLSTYEIVDFWVLSPITSMTELTQVLGRSSPEGIQILAAVAADMSQPALQAITDSAIYQVRLLEGMPDDLSDRLSTFLSLTTCVRTRRDKQYDLRTLVDSLMLTGDNPPIVEMRLALSQKRGTARPDEVIDALDLSSFGCEITRVRIDLDSPYSLGI